METIEICPQSIYSFQADNILVEEVLAQIKNIEYKDNIRNLVSKNVFYNKNLLDWFDTCLEKLREKVYPNTQKFVITSCWANKTNKTQQHHTHNHPNSFVSGVFYLTSHESGKTNFVLESFWHKFDRTWLVYTNQTNTITHKINPKSGLLLLFPSHLNHNTDVLNFKEKEVRYSISFNAFMTGKLESENITTQIDLCVKDYRETILNE